MIVAQERWEYTQRALRASRLAAWHAHAHVPGGKNKSRESCCEKKTEGLAFLILLLLNSKFNDNPNMANAECMERVMQMVVPTINSQLKAKGLDQNTIDYNDPVVKAVVNDAIVAALSTGVCSGVVVQKPENCPDPKVNVHFGTTPLPTTTRAPTSTTRAPTSTTKAPLK